MCIRDRVLPLTHLDSTIAFLPSAHIAQRVVIEFLPIRMGVPVWFSESIAKLPVAEVTEIRRQKGEYKAVSYTHLMDAEL